MTAPATAERRSRLVRPKVALPIIAAAVILVALLTPEQTGGRTGDARLSARSTSPQGAAAFYELAQRLGWRATQRLTDSIPPGDTAVVHLLLDPPVPPTPTETHQILERVRHGGGLLYVARDIPLSDSLGLHDNPGTAGTLLAPDTASCKGHEESILSAGLPFWPDRRTHILPVRWKGNPPPGAETLAWLDNPGGIAGSERPAAVGFPLGSGRVVVITDPDLLRNDVLRVCRWGADVAAVRMLEYLSEGGRRDLFVFDEYRQGYGEQPGTFRGIIRYLAHTPSGHLVLQLAGAGLVLLLAVGPRLLPPRPVERIERRSPLEHVDALAHAYRAVGATRTATSRLVHGVRRRVEHSLGALSGATSDDAFLAWAAQRTPARAADVDLVRHALAQPVSRRELEAVGQALRRLELALTSFPRTS